MKKVQKRVFFEFFSWAALILMPFLGGCRTRHEVESAHRIEPVEVKPIHITIDVNIRVDRALDDFFGDLDEADETIQ